MSVGGHSKQFSSPILNAREGFYYGASTAAYPCCSFGSRVVNTFIGQSNDFAAISNKVNKSTANRTAVFVRPSLSSCERLFDTVLRMVDSYQLGTEGYYAWHIEKVMG